MVSRKAMFERFLMISREAIEPGNHELLPFAGVDTSPY